MHGELKGFKGEPAFARNDTTQKAFSRLRSSIAGVYNWPVNHAKTPTGRQSMLKQAYALCPTSPESLFLCINLLVSSGRIDDATLLASITLNLDPWNAQIENLLKELGRMSQQQRTP